MSSKQKLSSLFIEQSNSLYLLVLKTLDYAQHGHNNTLNDITTHAMLQAFTTPTPTTVRGFWLFGYIALCGILFRVELTCSHRSRVSSSLHYGKLSCRYPFQSCR